MGGGDQFRSPVSAAEKGAPVSVRKKGVESDKNGF